MKIVASGLSGLIGGPLGQALSQKYDLVVLKRGASRKPARWGLEMRWDARSTGEWAGEVDGAYAVINLSGEPIAGKRWTAPQKKELRNSRLNTTRAFVEAISRAKIKPQVFVNASAVGFYGGRGDEVLDEGSSQGEGFLAELCAEWEAEALKAGAFGTRVALLRTGVVMAREGGALGKMLLPFRLGLGGPLGDGRQWMSWIHFEDEVAAILKVLETPALCGPINLSAPNPVRMKEFAGVLAGTLKRPALFHVPAPALKVLLGEMAGMLLTGQKALPRKLLAAGFRFRFENLEASLGDLLISS